MREHDISFEVDESPTTESVNEDGEYVFGIYTSNQCDDETQDKILQMVELWNLQRFDADISLTINVRLREVYETLYNMYNAQGKIDAEDKYLFDALRNDCQWIVEQINGLQVSKTHTND
jgi:hypothetical protein